MSTRKNDMLSEQLHNLPTRKTYTVPVDRELLAAGHNRKSKKQARREKMKTIASEFEKLLWQKGDIEQYELFQSLNIENQVELAREWKRAYI